MAGHRRWPPEAEPRPRQIVTKPENRRKAANNLFALARTDAQRMAIAYDYARGAIAAQQRRWPSIASVQATQAIEYLFALGDRVLQTMCEEAS